MIAFFVQIMPLGPKIVPPPGLHVLHRPLVGLQRVFVVFTDHSPLLFYIGIHEKILSETIKSL